MNNVSFEKLTKRIEALENWFGWHSLAIIALAVVCMIILTTTSVG